MTVQHDKPPVRFMGAHIDARIHDALKAMALETRMPMRWHVEEMLLTGLKTKGIDIDLGRAYE